MFVPNFNKIEHSAAKLLMINQTFSSLIREMVVPNTRHPVTLLTQRILSWLKGA